MFFLFLFWDKEAKCYHKVVEKIGSQDAVTLLPVSLVETECGDWIWFKDTESTTGGL